MDHIFKNEYMKNFFMNMNLKALKLKKSYNEKQFLYISKISAGYKANNIFLIKIIKYCYLPQVIC